jgi:hypothetical protein
MPSPIKLRSALALLAVNILISPAWSVDEGWLAQWANSDTNDQSSLLALEVKRAPEDSPTLMQMIKAHQPQLAANALRVMISTLGEMGQNQVPIAKRLASDNPDLLIKAAEIEPIDNKYMPDNLGVTPASGENDPEQHDDGVTLENGSPRIITPNGD